jgi:mRNA interferase MazF
VRRGDIWWVSFPQTSGGEIRKTRPAVIVSNNASNQHANRVQVLPVTSNVTRVFPSEALIKIGSQTSKAMADQILTVAKERLTRFEGSVSQIEMTDIERALRIQLGLGKT